MNSILSFVALVLVLHFGFALLALSQDRNWRLVVAAPSLSRVAKITLRIAGYALLALGLSLALWRDGPGFGSLMWGTLISLAACAVTMILSWRAHWMTPLGSAIRATTSHHSAKPR
ncbi:DUF3325 domain-containing protein [Nitrobacter winogradskyi]|uniref:DUF3325 domain-containing protein n=2 Tax=Nitrobacter winogradskyi TaxID=913 RepID=A0A4Y3WGI5_NITWI|nr:DUF3325 domain-containing protein [Nitrobacter winogradskyi]MCP1999792.1 uncharacterized protein YjeT (DUF2065 family) [Nitrobacter winogradskyi]GEC17638.1 hypothetical protein NWI01_35300 [Nitrobacter winogradskyi]